MTKTRLVVAALSCVLPLAVAEVIVRFALPQPGFTPFQPFSGLLIPHTTRGYAYRPGFAGQADWVGKVIDVSINSIGLRDRNLAAGERVDVLAVGDSFTAGFGVQAEEAWPSQLETRLNSTGSMALSIEVLNAGVSGYSLGQIRLLVDELSYLEPQIVIVGVYPSRFWRLNNPYTYLDGHAVLTSDVGRLKATDGGFLRSFVNERGFLQECHFLVMRMFHLGAHALEAVRTFRNEVRSLPSASPAAEVELAPLLSELDAIHGLLMERDTALALLLVNEQARDGSFSRYNKRLNAVIKSYGRQAGITVFDPIPYFEQVSSEEPVFRLGDDHHWSAAAHALVGRELGDFLLRKEWAARLLESP